VSGHIIAPQKAIRNDQLKKIDKRLILFKLPSHINKNAVLK
jgi:hypothetical protein